jgi:hypothetical protein
VTHYLVRNKARDLGLFVEQAKRKLKNDARRSVDKSTRELATNRTHCGGRRGDQCQPESKFVDEPLSID